MMITTGRAAGFRAAARDRFVIIYYYNVQNIYSSPRTDTYL